MKEKIPGQFTLLFKLKGYLFVDIPNAKLKTTSSFFVKPPKNSSPLIVCSNLFRLLVYSSFEE